MTARPIRRNAQTPDRNGKIFYTSTTSLSHISKGLWFVLDRDYNAYDTLAVVDNLQKKFEEGDILPESEIISNQAPVGPLGLEVASKPTNKAKRRLQTTVKK